MARLARTEVFDPHDVAIVHVMNRVVRRCFLLGHDSVSGKNFDHRKTWIENELKRLAASMGIDLLCFACLSNHFHLVLRSRPDVVATWSDEEVARRWCRLCPTHRCVRRNSAGDPTKAEIAMIIHCAERLQEIRLRLSDISWWMRLLCQKIAIRANVEDGEVGKFWQSRYRAVRLLDEQAVLACAAYVDLNPIRSAIAQTLEASDFTSVQRRIEAAAGGPVAGAEPEQEPASESSARDASALVRAGMSEPAGAAQSSSFLCPLELDERSDPLGPCANRTGPRCSDKGFLSMSLSSYLELLQWTARQRCSGKPGVPPRSVPPVLARLKLREEVWYELVSDFGRLFSVMAGRPHRIDEHRGRLHQRRYRVPRRTRELLGDQQP